MHAEEIKNPIIVGRAGSLNDRTDNSIPKYSDDINRYQGTSSVYNPHVSSIGELILADAKKKKTKKISPFTVVLFLFALAIASVLYISNKLAVNRLIVQINQMESKHMEMLNEQEILKAKINKLSSLERIRKIASEQLGLQDNKQLPVWLEVAPGREELINETIQELSGGLK